MVSFSQIIYALPAVFEMPFPTVFEDFLVSVMSLLSFSFLTEIKGFDCLYKTTFYSQFFIACTVPLGSVSDIIRWHPSVPVSIR